MATRAFGFQGPAVAVLGQGTWKMDEDDDDAAAIRALRAGLDAGMTHIDTAELYGAGRVEKLVAEAIAGRRSEVFLVSKVMPNNASRKGTVRACEHSLARLGTDHLDAYLLHWPGRHPLEDTIAAFEELVSAGKIRRWGVSNFDVEHLERALAIAGEHAIACNQVLYHLGERAIEHRVLPWCEAHGVAVVGYSPFGSGDFPSEESPGGRVLAEIGRSHGAGARQAALAFLTRRESLSSIPKSSNAAHVRANAAAGRIALSTAEIDRISAAFPLGPVPRGVPTI